MKIFAFGHQKQVGKDTAAKFMMSHLRTSGRFKRVVKAGFADKLKEVCHDLYGWAGMKSGEYYEEHQHEKELMLSLLGKTVRQVWIAFGNEVKRAAYTGTWIDYLLRKTTADVLIVKDMRFPNEANTIKRFGGKVIKIVRPDVLHTSDAADDPLLDYDDWDKVIMNDGSLSLLYDRVIEYAEECLNNH